jgi:imidazoleglycerol-phosphate dehydratase
MAENRQGSITRKTKETVIEATLGLDGTDNYDINTDIPLFTHMLELFSRHGSFDLLIRAGGDVEVDYHHLVEDAGIVLGRAFKQAIGDKRGIRRYGTAHVPMDEALCRVSIDISGRPYIHYEVMIDEPLIVHFNAQLAEEFFRAFAHSAEITLHIDLLRGSNAHHAIEAVFKAFGVALNMASALSNPGGDIPSTKGTL